MGKKFISIIVICAVGIGVLFGCTFSDNREKDEQQVTTESVVDTTEVEDSYDVSLDGDTASALDASVMTSETTTEAVTESVADDSPDASSGIISITDIPKYSGKAFVEIDGNIPDFTDEEKKDTTAFEIYSDLDKLGRCGVAFANICPELMPTEERGNIGDIRPSGWHTIKYPELIEDNYLYNRSHLIAYSLAGENANEKNLITGTRYLNQDTMQIFELRVLGYVRDTGSHVLYRVTPVFEDNNLLASGVQMEAWSVEDEGKGICFNVFCYNVQPGIDIDYATGDSKVANTTDDHQNDDTEEVVGGFENTEMDFVVNTNSMRIHILGCQSVADIAENNIWEYNGTLNDLKEQGYVPCGTCLAEYR